MCVFVYLCVCARACACVRACVHVCVSLCGRPFGSVWDGLSLSNPPGPEQLLVGT